MGTRNTTAIKVILAIITLMSIDLITQLLLTFSYSPAMKLIFCKLNKVQSEVVNI